MLKPSGISITVFLAVICVSLEAFPEIILVGDLKAEKVTGDIQLSLAGISVARSEWSFSAGRNDQPTTALILQMDRNTRDLLGLVVDKCELKYFTDDKGTDLLKGRDGPSEKTPNIKQTSSSNYSQQFQVTIHATSLPHPDAKKLKAEGSLVVKIGENKVTIVNRDVKIKEGSEINVGPAMMKITKVGPPDLEKHPWLKGRNGLAITIEGEVNNSIAKEFTFFDEQGNQLNMARMDASSSGEKKEKTSLNYTFYNHITKATVNVSYYANSKEVTIPFKIEAGLDLEEIEK